MAKIQIIEECAECKDYDRRKCYAKSSKGRSIRWGGEIDKNCPLPDAPEKDEEEAE